MIKQRVSEAVDKVKRQFTEDKQRLVLEANNKLRETVAAARNELESRMAQAQSLAVQEALKEANAQSNSKEVSKKVIRFFTEVLTNKMFKECNDQTSILWNLSIVVI